MELNREQVRLASKCCTSDKDMCNACPLNHLITCKEKLIKQMHRLNEQLTEENERLRAENAEQDEAIIRALKQMGEIRREAKADTVGKMQTEIEARCIKGGIYPAFVKNVVNTVTEEILKENQNEI